MSDLESLQALMEADRWIDKVRAQREHLAEITELADVEKELRSLASRLGEIEAVRRPARDAFNEAADRAESLRQRRSELERRMQSATAPARELTAMQQELDHLAKILNEAEDQEVGLLLELEPLDEVAHEIKTQAQPLAQRRAELQGTIRELQGSIDDELVHLREARAKSVENVSVALRARYDTALARSGVSGAARFDEGRCDGCRIALSPLDRDRVRQLGTNSFLDCPECGRILLPC
jgi:predicted  nucleic acid-binding Zn-ribbon protein